MHLMPRIPRYDPKHSMNTAAFLYAPVERGNKTKQNCAMQNINCNETRSSWPARFNTAYGKIGETLVRSHWSHEEHPIVSTSDKSHAYDPTFRIRKPHDLSATGQGALVGVYRQFLELLHLVLPLLIYSSNTSEMEVQIQFYQDFY